MRHRTWPRLVGVILIALILAACTPSVATPTSTPIPTTQPAVSTAMPTAVVSTTQPAVSTAMPTAVISATQPANPTAAPVQGGATGKIVYLADDGATIMQMQPDGSEAERIFTIPKQADDEVYDLAVAPDRSYIVYAVEGTAQGEGSEPTFSYYMLPAGSAQPIELGALFGPARLSPDGKRFILQQRDAGAPGNAVIYEPGTSQDAATLPFRGRATWFPDGHSLLYVPSRTDVGPIAIVRYDLASGKETTLLELTGEGQDAWYVQEAHAINTPQDGLIAVFYGAQAKNTGASGNGMQWFAMPATGGSFEPLTDPNGNQITAFASSQGKTWYAYGEIAHSNACISLGAIHIRAAGLGGGIGATAPVPGLGDVSQQFATRGLSWGADSLLALSMQPYTCASVGNERTYGEAAIYVWDVSTGNGTPVVFRKIADGAFPNWVQQ